MLHDNNISLHVLLKGNESRFIRSVCTAYVTDMDKK